MTNDFPVLSVKNIKTVSCIFTLLVFIVSCTKNNSPEMLIMQMPEASAIVKYRGVFQPTPGISISGFAKVNQKNNAYQLGLDSFSVSNGPDLKVYLSKEYPPTDFINLDTYDFVLGTVWVF